MFLDPSVRSWEHSLCFLFVCLNSAQRTKDQSIQTNLADQPKLPLCKSMPPAVGKGKL